MHGQSSSGKIHISKRLTRKAKSSMVHIIDMVKSRWANKSAKTSSGRSQVDRQSDCTVPMKAPLSRTLTQDEITETEMALTRLQAEKKRLEELLNSSSNRRHLSSLRSSGTSSYSNSCEDVSSNNNVRKQLVKIPRYQQKVAFLLHDVFTVTECEELAKELESNKEDVKSLESRETCTTHSEAMLNRLWPVIEKEVPKTWMGNRLLGLSNRCTLERQSVGYSRKPHMDEAYEPIEGKEKSFFSVYLFLNDDYEGGQSSFLKNWQPSSQDVQVQPTQGSVFIHQHNLLHQVIPVTSGTKHVVRLDVLYDTSKRDILSEMYD